MRNGLTAQNVQRASVIRERCSSYEVHPWKTTIAWVPWVGKDKRGEKINKLMWRVFVEPGFLNGRETYVKLDLEEAEQAIADGLIQDDGELQRAKENKASIVWYSLCGSGVSLDPTNLWKIPSSIPDYLVDIGVRRIKKSKEPEITKDNAMDIMGGADLEVEVGYEEKETGSREAMFCDLVFAKRRQKVSIDISQENSTVQLVTRSFVFSGKNEDAHLRIESEYTIPERSWDYEGGMLERLQEAYTDNGEDTLHVARLWALTPELKEGESITKDTKPDARWQMLVQQKLFWNLHSSSPLLYLPPDNPITVQTGLPMADMITGAWMSYNNMIYNQINVALANMSLEQKFWI